MKIAITSTGDNSKSILDSRFGRCSWFAIYDKETGSMEYIKNPNKEAMEGAGPASVQFLASRGVEKVVSGEFGFKVKALFDSLGVTMITIKEENKTVGDIVALLNN